MYTYVMIEFTRQSILSSPLGGGGVQGQGKGQRLMTTFGWQHAKVESMKSNPPHAARLQDVVLLGSDQVIF